MVSGSFVDMYIFGFQNESHGLWLIVLFGMDAWGIQMPRACK